LSDRSIALAGASTSGEDRASSASHPAYRPDIDGLRAVAVLSVVAFHVGIHQVSGGFVGVDIFFVISGYLITLIMFNQIGAGRFSIVRFYERRIRRIFPALIATLLVTSVLAYRLMLPDELRDYSYSLLAAMFSVSNIYFWAQSGYFDAPAQSKPLLHTWSLGVEEQCYILLPIILQIVHRYFPNGVKPTLAVLAAVSLAISAVGAFTDPEATFYLVHTRAWELLLGGLIALDFFPVPHGAVWRNAMTLIGLAMIAFAILCYTPRTPFPGLTALVPCVGSGLIILAGRGGPSLVGRLLSLRPVVFFGLISYSLYLWHWPILVFQSSDAILLSAKPRIGRLAVVFVSIGVATLSWALIERPFRRGTPSRRVIFGSAAGGVAVVVATALALVAAPSRFSPAAVAVASYLGDKATHMRDGTCFIYSANTFAEFDKATCITPAADKPNVLILGDSEAAHLWYGMAHVFHNDNVMQATASGCKPTLDAEGASRCTEMMQYIYGTFLPAHPPNLLVISARWDPGDLPALGRTLAWTRDHHIKTVLFGPIVEYDAPLPRILALALEQNDPGTIARHRTDERALDAQMAALAKREGVPFVSLYDELCPDGQCVVYAAPGVPLQFDYGHLTQQGSMLLAQRLAKAAPLRFLMPAG
jgi:peptidoglycan/LPS O-acetylase OafA/YrhL